MGKLRNDDGIEDHVNCATDGLLFVTGLRSGLVNNNNLIYKAPVCRETSVGAQSFQDPSAEFSALLKLPSWIRNKKGENGQEKKGQGRT